MSVVLLNKKRTKETFNIFCKTLNCYNIIVDNIDIKNITNDDISKLKEDNINNKNNINNIFNIITQQEEQIKKLNNIILELINIKL